MNGESRNTVESFVYISRKLFLRDTNFPTIARMKSKKVAFTSTNLLVSRKCCSKLSRVSCDKGCPPHVVSHFWNLILDFLPSSPRLCLALYKPPAHLRRAMGLSLVCPGIDTILKVDSHYEIYYAKDGFQSDFSRCTASVPWAWAGKASMVYVLQYRWQTQSTLHIGVRQALIKQMTSKALLKLIKVWKLWCYIFSLAVTSQCFG